MTDLYAALVQQFLNVAVAERITVVEPDGVLDDAEREAVAVRGRVGHSGSAYPSAVKATQPSKDTSSSRPSDSNNRPFSGTMSSKLQA